MGILYTVFDVNPILSGLVIGLLFGLTGYAKEGRENEYLGRVVENS